MAPVSYSEKLSVSRALRRRERKQAQSLCRPNYYQVSNKSTVWNNSTGWIFFYILIISQAGIIVQGGEIGVLISPWWNYSTTRIFFIALRMQVILIQNITFSIAKWCKTVFFFLINQKTIAQNLSTALCSVSWKTIIEVYTYRRKKVSPPPPPCRQVPPNFDHILLGKTVISL